MGMGARANAKELENSQNRGKVYNQVPDAEVDTPDEPRKHGGEFFSLSARVGIAWTLVSIFAIS
jgi:hypothetical protein